MAIELEPLYLRFDKCEPAHRRLSPSPYRRPALRVNTAQRVPLKRPMSTQPPIYAPIPKCLPSTNIHAAHNDSLPISKLPTELLVCIVNVARNLDLSADEHPSGRVASFSLVCRRFRKDILSAPHLWSTIAIHANATYGLQFAALCLTRAGHAPLELWLDSFYSAAQVVPFIEPHGDRIRHIRLRVPVDVPPALVASTCAFQVPNLESLNIAPSASEAQTSTPLVLPSLFSAGCTNRIARLTLVDCAPPPGTYPTLTHLHLSGRIPGLVDLLRGCATTLRTLFLVKIDCEDVRADEAPIELSSLDSLSVVSAPAATGQNFFNRLALRPQCQICVYCHMSTSMDENALAMPALRAMRSLLDSRTSHADTLQLYVDEKRVRLVTSGESRVSLSIGAREAEPTEPGFEEEEEEDWSASAVRTLLQTLPLDSVRSVWIVAEDQLPVDVVAVLSALTGVREFAAQGVALADVSRALSTATPTGLVAPDLETLRLQRANYGRDALAVLRGALEARVSHGTRLRRLVLQGDVGAGTKKLRELVDELQVVNDMPMLAPAAPPEWTG
ncbi:hypothetical protein PENSPDRAFT_690316 [Peniophora sp. CONT]|nr:hypothetical protein PENSPDRAFT_690316 [Peniophora sp. CONT]